MMRRVKVPGLDIQIPPGSAFKIDTPPMMPKMHLLAAVVAPRGYGKGVIHESHRTTEGGGPPDPCITFCSLQQGTQ